MDKPYWDTYDPDHENNLKLLEEKYKMKKEWSKQRQALEEMLKDRPRVPLKAEDIGAPHLIEWDEWEWNRPVCCWKCMEGKNVSRYILCPDCGNKRCPKASDHDLQCTQSNEPGQKGSVY
jgi:hypothetical protein